eukprot:TRINITY_DN36408_c0_g1_i1.p1 TRINITY_DN36408_c0_g1~~TRINITY_DN36408_c0_g1_i1.p1  ORF type:complete len:107 (+),score=6.30 TRINITY_DN36408_c0_g1_i1:402-722(+)
MTSSTDFVPLNMQMTNGGVQQTQIPYWHLEAHLLQEIGCVKKLLLAASWLDTGLQLKKPWIQEHESGSLVCYGRRTDERASTSEKNEDVRIKQATLLMWCRRMARQ